MYDMNPFVDYIIVVDGVKEGASGVVEGVDNKPKTVLEDTIMAALTKRTPSIAVRSLQCGVSSMPKPSMVCLVCVCVSVCLSVCLF